MPTFATTIASAAMTAVRAALPAIMSAARGAVSSIGSILPGVVARIPAAANTLKSSILLLKGEFDKLVATLNAFSKAITNIQKSFGVNISKAGALGAFAFTESAKSVRRSLTALGPNTLKQVNEATRELYGIGVNAVQQAASGKPEDIMKAVEVGASSVQKLAETPMPEGENIPPLDYDEILASLEGFQNEFGVIAREQSLALAQYAKKEGVNIQDLIQARRVFTTVALGDLNKIDAIQNRMINQFKAGKISPKIAFDIIAKNSELIARNGLRFADAFVRAAIEAKKIGVDLQKVDQFGDNIIDNFEGFLEKSAEAGALGLNIDTSRLAEIAFTGDTGALFEELQSQLQNIGKDITQLDRPTRLVLEGLIGMPISEAMKMAGMTPEIEADPVEESNTLLGAALTFLQSTNTAINLIRVGVDAIVTILRKDLLTTAVGLLTGGTSRDLNEKTLKALQEKNAPEAIKQGAGAGALRGILPGMGVAALTIGALALMGTGVGVPAGLALLAGGAGVGAGVGAVTGGVATGYEYSKQRHLEEANKNLPRKSLMEEMQGKATGGLISGPGTPTSDSIPTMLSNGEYVINASAVKKVGIDTLDKINQVGNMPKMQDGGLVGDTVGAITRNIPGIEKLIDGVARLSKFGEQFSQTITTLTQSSGGLGRLTNIGDTISGKLNTFIGNITSKLPSNIGGRINEFVSTKAGGFVEGLKSKALGFLSDGKLGGGGSPVESVVGGLKERAMGVVSKIPGIGGIIGKAANIFGGGGIKGLASAALGKIGLGGLLGGAAAGPIGMIGSLAAPLLKRIPIVGGVLSNIANAPSKLIGGAFKSIGGLFGRKKKTPTVQPSIASMLGGGEDAGELSATMLPQLMGAGGLDAFNIAALAGAPPPNIQAPAATQQVKVDISNLEQKFDQLIRAFSNIQVNMDGNKVGNILVNSTKTAANVGPIKTQSVPTL